MRRELRAALTNGKFENVSGKRSVAMGAVKSRDNRSTERRVRSALVRAGIRGWGSVRLFEGVAGEIGHFSTILGGPPARLARDMSVCRS